MRILKIISIAVLSLAVLVGCGNNSDNEAADTKEQTEEAKELEAEFQENRDEFIAENKARLDSLENKLTELGKDIQGESGEAKRQMEQTWSNLKKQTETIRKNIETLENATRENWEKFRSTASDQMEYLESEISKLEEQLNL